MSRQWTFSREIYATCFLINERDNSMINYRLNRITYQNIAFFHNYIRCGSIIEHLLIKTWDRVKKEQVSPFDFV